MKRKDIEQKENSEFPWNIASWYFGSDSFQLQKNVACQLPMWSIFHIWFAFGSPIKTPHSQPLLGERRKTAFSPSLLHDTNVFRFKFWCLAMCSEALYSG